MDREEIRGPSAAAQHRSSGVVGWHQSLASTGYERDLARLGAPSVPSYPPCPIPTRATLMQLTTWCKKDHTASCLQKATDMPDPENADPDATCPLPLTWYRDDGERKKNDKCRGYLSNECKTLPRYKENQAEREENSREMVVGRASLSGSPGTPQSVIFHLEVAESLAMLLPNGAVSVSLAAAQRQRRTC